MIYYKKLIYNIILCVLSFVFFLFSIEAKSSTINKLIHLKHAYPNYIYCTNNKYITWSDGTKMSMGKRHTSTSEKLNSPSLIDQLDDVPYSVGRPKNFSRYRPVSDPGRIKYEPFFLKMYGQSKKDVESKLTTIYWMHRVFGNQYPLRVTTVNSVNKKLLHISDELELLVMSQPKFLKFVDHPAGTFKWRDIKFTNRLSSHSFGIAIDINAANSNYWEWDLQKNHQPVLENKPLTYKNQIPWEIIKIFEKYGFIWGGKWYHYDTMHFEYRPELILDNE